MSNKLVSVIINSHNGAKFINKSVNSVLNQTYKNLEIIFWDNASVDNSKEILQQINDARIKINYSEKFEKLYSAKNKAVKLSKGEFLAFLDVDDWWEKDKLEIQILEMEKRNCGLSCSNYWIINEKKNSKFPAFKKNIIRKNHFDSALKKYFVGMSTLIIKRDIYNSLDYGFDHSYEIIGDYDLVLRLLKNHKIVFLNNKLSFYRWHINNLSKKKFKLNILELIIWRKKMLQNKFFFTENSKKYLYDHILFLMSLYFKKKNNNKKIIFFLTKINSFKVFCKIFFLLITPKEIINKIRS